MDLEKLKIIEKLKDYENEKRAEYKKKFDEELKLLDDEFDKDKEKMMNNFNLGLFFF